MVQPQSQGPLWNSGPTVMQQDLPDLGFWVQISPELHGEWRSQQGVVVYSHGGILTSIS